MEGKFMKKFLMASLFLMLFSTPAYASVFGNFYTFEGTPQANFGRHTEVEETYQAPHEENRKVNKDSAFIPPRFGSRTADTPQTGELLTPNISGVEPMRLGGTGESIFIYTPSVGGGGGGNTTGWVSNQSLIQADGTIGRLQIPAIGLNVRCYAGEDNINRGVGHFSVTSAWGGNVGYAGHNRGVNAYFGRIHELRNGDIITYSTMLGTMDFAVFSVRQVNEYDTSILNASADDIITLVTCVRNVPSMRWVVQARRI